MLFAFTEIIEEKFRGKNSERSAGIMRKVFPETTFVYYIGFGMHGGISYFGVLIHYFIIAITIA